MDCSSTSTVQYKDRTPQGRHAAMAVQGSVANSDWRIHSPLSKQGFLDAIAGWRELEVGRRSNSGDAATSTGFVLSPSLPPSHLSIPIVGEMSAPSSVRR